MTHIAVFLPSMRGGGAERALARIAAGLARRGHQVDLVLAQVTGPWLADLPPDVRIVDLKAPRLRYAALPLLRFLRRCRPQVLLSALTHTNLLALLVRRLAGVPLRLVISERNSLSRLTDSRQGRVALGLMRRCYPWSDAIVSVSEGVAEELTQLLGARAPRSEVICNPLMPQVIGPPEPGCRHPWLMEDGPPLILAMGRLQPQKDFAGLIRAFAQLRQSRPARLVILGEGPQRAELAQYVSSLGLDGAVLMPGFQPESRVWIERSSVFVLSSRYEGFSNALMEALGYGANIVSTDCPWGPAGILEGGRWGQLVPPGDPGALAQAMCHALDIADQRDSLAQIEAARRRFELEAILDRYEAVLTGAGSAG